MSDNQEINQEETIDLSNEESKAYEDKLIIPNAIEPESPTCALCKHAACNELTEIYFNNNKSIEISKNWFEKKFKRPIVDKTYEKHFHEHIEPFVSETQIIRQQKLKEIQKTALENENLNAIPIIKQSLFEMFLDVFVSKKEGLKTKEERGEHAKASKEMVELAKAIREYHQMQLEIMGMGKTEEEQKEVVENYMTSMIKDAVSSLNEFPEAQQRLNQILQAGIGKSTDILDNEGS
ncbi:MAG TPA: hypothetical protein VMZ91_08725 [Candidatus Paceibacterota bacterium]|nr:hypothetical protein [Candidatus Paceibacterota bacterium]